MPRSVKSFDPYFSCGTDLRRKGAVHEDAYTAVQLKEIASAYGVKYYGSMTKKELCREINRLKKVTTPAVRHKRLGRN